MLDFRHSLSFFSVLLWYELLSRTAYFDVYYHPTTSIVPLASLHDQATPLYNFLCIHGWFQSPWWFYFSIANQICLAYSITVVPSNMGGGISPSHKLLLSFLLYVSLQLRNTYLSYILDRYFTIFLFLTYLVIRSYQHDNKLGMRVATALYTAQLLFIYADAGLGKYNDPNDGWGFSPVGSTLPALDTYCRHTLPARLLYTLLGPTGMAILTPIVLYTEILVPPLTIATWYMGWGRCCNTGVALMIALHLGIGLSMRNAGSLSAVASVVWLPFYIARTPPHTHPAKDNKKGGCAITILATLIFILASIYTSFIMDPASCNAAASSNHSKSPLTTIFHNRWNVFTGSETHVTWEIAPGQFADGRIRDIWTQSDEISWDLPVGASSTTTTRGGRWRSFPYLIHSDDNSSDESTSVWSYLCRENPGLERFKFWMLSADTLPNMQYGETRKRLVVEWTCQ